MHESDALGKIASELVINGSIELSTESLEVIPLAKRLLPFGMAVYLPKMLRRPLEDKLPMINALHAAVFDPVPHIAARQVDWRRVYAATLIKW